MIDRFHKPNVIKFSDKILLYCQLHLLLSNMMRIILGKQRRDQGYKKHNHSWMNTITGRKLLIKNEQEFRFWIRSNSGYNGIVSTEF
jgi:hypothetical protein